MHESMPRDDHRVSHLLVADDEPGLRDLIQFLLEPLGWKVTAVPDGLAAAEFLRDEQVDVVLADVHMPRLSGLDLLDQVKRMQPALPVLVMTSGSDPLVADRSSLKDRGAAGLLLKPFEIDDFFAALKAVER